MNRLLKTMLGIVLCLLSALPAMAEIKIEEDNSAEGSIISVVDGGKLFYSTETMTSAKDVQSRKDALGMTGALSDDGQSELVFTAGITCSQEYDCVILVFYFIPVDSFKSKLDANDKLTIRFADGKTDEFFINSKTEEDGGYSVGGLFGALSPEDFEIHRMPMNEEMIQYATSDIKSISCGGMTYHIKGHTAPFIKSLFSALFNHKGVSKDGFSIYLNSVDSRASSPKTTGGSQRQTESKRKSEPKTTKLAASTAPVAAVSDYSEDETALASLLKNPAGYAGRSPFSSPGVYEVDFKNYASQNSLNYRTRSHGGGSVSLIFDNGAVPDNLMGYDCKFVASFKNQILNGYVYQSVVLNREQAESLARKLASELMGMGNVDRATGFQKSPDAMFSEQYLYGAGTRVIVDARQADGRYVVSLIVSITHF